MAKPADEGSDPELAQDEVSLVVGELTRVIGAEEFTAAGFQFEWMLPITNTQDFLTLMRAAPTGIGVVGLQAYFIDKLGTLSGLKAIEDDVLDPDV